MDGQQRKLKEILDKHGWELVEARTIDHRWYVAMWLIKSIWSPTDCFAFFTFETDPELYKPTGKLSAYKVLASLRKPVDWMAESESQFERNETFADKTNLFLKNIDRDIPEFFKDLANMRQKFYNFYY